MMEKIDFWEELKGQDPCLPPKKELEKWDVYGKNEYCHKVKVSNWWYFREGYPKDYDDVSHAAYKRWGTDNECGSHWTTETTESMETGRGDPELNYLKTQAKPFRLLNFLSYPVTLLISAQIMSTTGELDETLIGVFVARDLTHKNFPSSEIIFRVYSICKFLKNQLKQPLVLGTMQRQIMTTTDLRNGRQHRQWKTSSTDDIGSRSSLKYFLKRAVPFIRSGVIIKQGMMDVALITANANQLRFIVEYNQASTTFVFAVTLIVISLVLQIIVGICLIFKGRLDLKGEDKFKHANTMNNYIVVGVFIITIVNVFVAAFSTGPPPLLKNE